MKGSDPMKPISMIALIIVLSLSGSFVFTLVLDMASGEETSATERLSSRIKELDTAISELSAGHRELAGMVLSLQGRSDGAQAPPAREPVVSIEEAVDRWIRRNRPDLLVENDSASPAEPEAFAGTRLEQAAQWLTLLDDPGQSDEEWNAIWQKIDEAGLMKEALAILEDNVEKDPGNPETHLALAGGYFGMSVNTANDMEKGIWAVKADKTLDRALELDPMHWEARFTKAISLSLYPPVMGKQGEAMKHFEILLDQQKKLPPRASHARTYLYLGNLHMQMGNHEKAGRIWKEGLNLFPGNAELIAQLNNAMKD
jgi:tetratricopeptide (TPR) repeat protein